MATTSTAVWEIRTSGNGNNGGGYDAGIAGAGTDYSQADVPILVVTDGVVGVATNILTSATGGFTAAMVGNALTLIQSASFKGHFWITGFTNANTITLDQNPQNLSAYTVTIGGASTIAGSGFVFIQSGSFAHAVAGNKIWIKGPGAALGDYQPITNEPTLSISGTATAPFTVEGYTTTRGDNGRPTIVNNAGALTGLTVSGSFVQVKNLDVKNNSGTFAALNVTGGYNCFRNCVGQGGTPLGISHNDNLFVGCEIKNSNTAASGINLNANFSNFFDRCQIHGNGQHGVALGTAGGNRFLNCSIYANTLDGFNQPVGQGFGIVIENCNIWNNGRDGIRLSSTSADGALRDLLFPRNIFGKHAAGYDINYTVSDVSASTATAEWAKFALECNAFLTTGLGRYHNLPANATDLVLTTSPFTSDANFTLNSTAGGGLSIRQNPCISTLPDSNLVYSYIGASAPQTATVVTGQTQMRNMWREFTGELDATTPNADGGLGIPSTDTVDLYIWRGLEFLNRRIEYHYTTDLTTVALVAGTQEYTLPSDCIVIRWVEWNGIRLAKRDVDDWNREEKDWRQEPTGAPFEWAHEGTRIIFRYTPDAEAVVADSTVTVRYISTPPDFTASGPDQLLTEDFALAVAAGVYLWSIAHPDSALAVQRAQGFKAMFDEEASGVLEKYKARSISR